MLQSLIEIRQRILYVLICFCTFFVLCYLWANPLWLFIISPLQHELSSNSPLIATQLTSTVLTPLMLAANLAVLCTTPLALLQIWLFIAPGLYQHEKKLFIQLSVSSLLLFVCGMLFCFVIVLPLLFQFFTKALPTSIKLMPDIVSSTAFITHMLWLFGLAFQVPLICVLCVKLGWLQRQTLKNYRPYVIVGAFIIGMLLTPPDVVSQILLAVPLCLLYEVGILFTAIAVPKTPKTQQKQSSPTPTHPS